MAAILSRPQCAKYKSICRQCIKQRLEPQYVNRKLKIKWWYTSVASDKFMRSEFRNWAAITIPCPGFGSVLNISQIPRVHTVRTMESEYQYVGEIFPMFEAIGLENTRRRFNY